MGKIKKAVKRAKDTNRKWQVVLLIFALAFCLRIWGISFGLPGVDHGDETEVVNHAVRFGSGDFNPHRFQYGSLVQYILFFLYGLYYVIGYLLGYFSSAHNFGINFINDPTVFYLIARGLSALLGGFTVYVTYRIGLKAGGVRVGLCGALFLAVCFQHAVHSHYATVDTALTFLFALATYQSLMLLFDNRPWRYCIAGVAIGLTIATKLNGVLLLVPFALSHFLRDEKIELAKKIVSQKFWLGLMMVFVGHFIASPFFYIDLKSALSEVFYLRSMHAAPELTLFAYLKSLANDYWGIPLGMLCVAGLLRYLITTDRRIAVVSLTTLAILCFASLHRYVESKYILYGLPLFSVLGSRLLIEVFQKMKTQYLMVTILSLMVHPLYLTVSWNLERSQKSITLESKEWIEQNLPVNAKVLLDNVGNGGPKLHNSPSNLINQYQRARQHNLLKAEYLALQLESSPSVFYDITQVDSPGGFREDDYKRYRLWQDTEEIGHPEGYYRERGYEYIIITNRYFSQIGEEFRLLKEFTQGKKGIRIYKIG
jgi:hypothetical protein